jgi:hypothetical protein
VVFSQGADMNGQGMEPLMNLLIALVLLSLGIDGLLTIITRKFQLFSTLKWFVKKGSKGFGRLCRGLSKALDIGANSAFRTAGHGRTSWPARLFLYPMGTLLWLSGVIMAIPAEIFGEVAKKKY